MLNKSQNIIGKVFIVHCESADPDQHWYHWLQQQLIQLGTRVERIFLADAAYPTSEIWQTCLDVQLKELDERSIVIAHGLSCLAIARFLTYKLSHHRIRAGIFIAGFNESIPKHPEFNAFINHSHFIGGILRANIQRRLVLFSSNDPIVPVPLTFKFSHLINAQLIEIAQAGHFRSEDGYREFPQLLHVLQTLLKSEVTT